MQRTEEITAKALARVGQDRYKLVMLVSKRADQLANGAEPLVKADKNKQKFTDIALLEISEGKIRLESITDLQQFDLEELVEIVKECKRSDKAVELLYKYIKPTPNIEKAVAFTIAKHQGQ